MYNDTFGLLCYYQYLKSSINRSSNRLLIELLFILILKAVELIFRGSNYYHYYSTAVVVSR